MTPRAEAIYPTMHITCCVLCATLVFSLIFFTNAMTRTNGGGDANVDTVEKYYTVSVILQIQFKNKCKKSCTGTIISDTVVITAARCLVYGDSKRTRSPINIDMSFVVVGTKKMHASGREQYLPIERLQFHPELKTKHVDLVLVYTDMSLKTDRGGAIAKLIKNKVIENERDVMVVSWEPMSEEERKQKGIILGSNIFVPNDDEDTKGRQIGSSSESRQNPYKDHVARTPTSSESRQNPYVRAGSKGQLARISISSESRQNPYLRAVSSHERVSVNSTTNDDENPDDSTSKSTEQGDTDDFLKTEKKPLKKDLGFRRNLYDLGIVNKQSPNILASAKFLLLTPLMCRTFLNRIRPKVYSEEEISNIACFTSDTRYVTDADLGAGVFYNGKLFAVTVDHVELNLQYVGLAMQVSCFCPWLTRKGGDVHCVPTCCMKGDHDLESQAHSYYSYDKTTRRHYQTSHETDHYSIKTTDHIKTSDHSTIAVNINTSPTSYGGGDHSVTTTRSRYHSIDSFSGFPEFSSSPHTPEESDEPKQIVTRDKIYTESSEAHEKGYSESFTPPTYKVTEKSVNGPTTYKGQVPQSITSIESSAKKPNFKSLDEFISRDAEAPIETMKLMSYATETNERMIDSRLVGLEYYLVD